MSVEEPACVYILESVVQQFTPRCRLPPNCCAYEMLIVVFDGCRVDVIIDWDSARHSLLCMYPMHVSDFKGNSGAHLLTINIIIVHVLDVGIPCCVSLAHLPTTYTLDHDSLHTPIKQRIIYC